MTDSDTIQPIKADEDGQRADIVELLRRAAPFMRTTNNAGIIGQHAHTCEEAALLIERLRAALKPFVFFAENVDADGWTSNIHRERISVWFGPSDFRNAHKAFHNEE